MRPLDATISFLVGKETTKAEQLGTITATLKPRRLSAFSVSVLLANFNAPESLWQTAKGTFTAAQLAQLASVRLAGHETVGGVHATILSSMFFISLDTVLPARCI